MQAKMDYLELVNQQAEAEDQADEDDCDKWKIFMVKD